MRQSVVCGLIVGFVGSASAQPTATLDREQIVNELGDGPRLAPMNRCSAATGQFGARVKIVVAPDGKVDDVDVASTDKQLQTCMAQRLLGLRFPRTQQGATVGYEYRFRGIYPNVVARPIAVAAVGPDPCEPVAALVAQEMFDEALALHSKLPACRGDRDRVVQRAIVRACKRGEAAKAVAYAKQTHLVWLDGMYACKDAKIRLPAKREGGMVHVAHGKDRAWLEVAIDGEMFGTGPINAEVSAGSHRIEIWDARTGKTRKVMVRVPSGGHVHLDDQGRRVRIR